jgi:hypothetical protein
MGRSGGSSCFAALAVAFTTSALSAEPVLSLEAGSDRLDIPPSAISAMEISESGGITDVFLRLMPGASDALADLTEAAIGQTMTLRVCGTPLMAPVVQERIDSGTIYLPGTTMIRAEAMRALWHGRASCDTLQPEVFEHGQ